MRTGDQFRFVRQNMKKNKTRLFMTVLATAMGCAFLIVLASVGFGLQRSIVDEMVGDRLVTAIEVHGKDTNVHETSELTGEDLRQMRSLPGVKAVTYRNYIGQWMNPSIQGEPVGSNSVLQLDFEAEKEAGFDLAAGSTPQADDEIVIGYHIRELPPVEGANGEIVSPGPEELPDASEWLGEKMAFEVAYYENGEKRTKAVEATVVGVAAIPAKEWERDKNIYVGEGVLKRIEAITGTRFGELPYFDKEPTAEQIEQAMSEMPKPEEERSYNRVNVIAKTAQEVKGISEKLREDGYYNYSIADELKQVNVMFLIMKIGLVFVGTIAVLIASIGIFNTMTMAVTERAGDIGIMKAIGARPSVIRRIFLLESGMIGLLGALIGTAVSYAISAAVNAGLPLLITALMEEKLPAEFRFSVIPPYLAVLSCVIALGVAVLSGYRPAKRATRVDVLRALRRDL